MAFSNNFPRFTLRRDTFPQNMEGQKMYDELLQFANSMTEFHRELVNLLYERVKLTKYTNAAAANTAFVEAQGHLAYNTTDNQPMYHNGNSWRKVTDGTAAS